MYRKLNRLGFFAILSMFLLALPPALLAGGGTAHAVQIIVPEFTPLHVTLNDAVASNRSTPGDRFEATLTQPVVVDGETVIPKGAQATGVVVDAKPSGRFKGRAHLQLALETISVGDDTYEIRTATDTRIVGKHTKRSFGFVGGGVGGGLLIGALVAGGEGALIGGPIGAGAGTVVILVTSKRDIRLPAETAVTFELARPATIDVPD